MHQGHTLTARTVLFDTCSEVNLLSKEFVCLLQDTSGHSNVLKAGKAEELKNAIASPTKKYP